MRARIQLGVVSTLAAAIVAVTMVAGAEGPQCVSPGVADRVAVIEARCPTFTWALVPGAAFNELLVYELPEMFEIEAGLDLDWELATEVLYTRLPGGATSWTPTLADCLAPGGRYAWFVGAVHDPEAEEVSEWSAPKLFTVSRTPQAREVKEALGLLRRFIEEGGRRVEEPGKLVSGEGAQVAKRSAERSAAKSVSDDAVRRSVPTAPAAIRGEQPDLSGESYGVVGISASPDGSGLAAANMASGGADLRLDGSVDGAVDAQLRESGIDRSSVFAQTFTIGNSDLAGGMTLQVDGGVQANSLDTVTAATLAIGASNATSVTISADTTISGTLTTEGGRVIDMTGFVTPVGAIVAFGGAVAPAGWLLCDGSLVARASFADLYAVVGDAYGEGDGATTFHLPDLRGRFPRGVDGGVGRDPDAPSRVASNSGGNVGDAVGSLQDDAVQGHRHGHSDPGHSHGVTDPGHSHTYYGWIFIGPYAAGAGANFASGPTGTSLTGISIDASSTNVAILDPAADGEHGTPRISSETRPQNVSVNYIVKY